MKRKDGEIDWSNIVTPLLRPRRNDADQYEHSRIVSKDRLDNYINGSVSVMSVNFRALQFNQSKVDLQSRSPINLVNARDDISNLNSMGIMYSANSQLRGTV